MTDIPKEALAAAEYLEKSYRLDRCVETTEVAEIIAHDHRHLYAVVEAARHHEHIRLMSDDFNVKCPICDALEALDRAREET